MAEKDYKTYTEHYKLVKPGDLEKYDIEEVTRTNADIIDTELKKHEIAISNLHNYDDTSIKKDMLKLQKEQENHTELINNKVDKQEGKDLSTNDFTDAYKQKVDDLENYDDTEIKQKYNELQQENIELKKTQDDMIEKQLNKQTEADTSLVIKDTDEGYGKLSVYGGQRQEKREGYNKLKIVATTQTSNGVKFTVNEDGTVVANGTATEVSYIALNKFVCNADTYILSGCPARRRG